MGQAKLIDPKTIDNPVVWLKLAERTQRKQPGRIGSFLADTRGFLGRQGGERCKAVFAQLDYNKIAHNVALEALFAILMTERAEELIKKTAEGEKSKAWKVTIWAPNPMGGERAMVTQNCGSEQEARGWCDRFLFNHSASDWWGEIEGKRESTKYRVDRQDAIARLNPKPVKPATTIQVKLSASRLSWGVGGQYNKKYYFSRG